MVTVNSRLILEVEVIHDLSCHRLLNTIVLTLLTVFYSSEVSLNNMCCINPRFTYLFIEL